MGSMAGYDSCAGSGRGCDRSGSRARRGRPGDRSVVVLVAWADDRALAEVEGHQPAAIAAVADWPDSIKTWLSIHAPERIGGVRAEQEAEFVAPAIVPLDAREAKAFDSVAAMVNEHHSVLSIHEREWLAGALVALRNVGVPVDQDALRGHLMSAGWGGRLIDQAISLAERVARGETPRHRHFSL
jgi:hypothetical protein